MKKVFSLALSFILLLGALPFSALALTGKTYYIDSLNGDDANNGYSPEQAWKTTANLADIQLFAGDKLLFRKGGAYECTLTLTASGTKENPIVISNYGEEENLPLLYTDKATEILRLFDCSYITVDGLEMTAHNGGGIWIDTLTKESKGITLKNLTIHDIQNGNWHSRDTLSGGAAVARACVMVKGLPARSYFPVNDLTVIDCEMYDCGNGISLWGSWNEEQNSWCENKEDINPCFNENTLVKNVYFHDMAAEAVIVGICKNALVTNCRAIDCCQDTGLDENGEVKFFNAAMWFWGSQYSTIQYCEIAGQKNVGDGMAVDFDSYSHNCTYQYIYSHDNNCFMCNCPNYDGQYNNTVRYCLSVNDNNIRSRVAGDSGEYNFSFYNNTIINCGDFYLINMHDSLVANNIFIPMDGCLVTSDEDELVPFNGLNNTYTNNCYYNCPNPLVDLKSMNQYPGFVSDKTDSPACFMLAKDSELIGAGIKMEGYDGGDLYSEVMTSNNIGCYAGMGETEKSPVHESLLMNVIRVIRSIVAYIVSSVKRVF